MRLQRRITTAGWRRTRYSSRRFVVGAKSGKTYSAATLSAFGEDLTHHCPPPPTFSTSFFTGKPAVAGLGHAFLMRNYRADLAKWQTADPMGYPDGWNALVYCNNGVSDNVDFIGASTVKICDLASGVEVNNVNQLTVGGTTGNQNGSCEIGYSYAKSSNYKLTMYLCIDANIAGIESSQWSSGSIATYNEHEANETDSSLTRVEEAVKAHELGHAAYVMDTMKGLMKAELDALEQQWRTSRGGVDNG